MFEAQRPRGVPRPGEGQGHVPREAAGPSPYDLYIGFQDVAALWACETRSPGELVVRCAFQSIEMGLALLVDAAQDPRPAARPRARLEALTEDLVQQVQLARRLLADSPLPPHRAPAPAASPSLEMLRALAPEHRDLVARLTDAVLAEPFPAPLGLEPGLQGLRAAHGLPPREAPAGPYLPYARWIQPARVLDLVHRDAYCREDRLFATVHQMTECWLRLVLDRFARAEGMAREERWDDAARLLEGADEVLDFLARHIELLHLMVVADYHPLRVALRGASGAQSAAARVITGSAREFLPLLARRLEGRGLAILDVLRFPHEHPDEHRYLEAVGGLERRLMVFYFQHFQLARKVLGTRSLGSLGYEVRALAERFTRPVFPDLDEARYDHTMLTNLAHGNEAGLLIARREEVVEPLPPPPGVPREVAEAALARYFEAVRAMDLDAWVATFDPAGSMEDPVGSRPHRGLAELKVFFQGVQRTFARLDVQPEPMRLDGARAVVTWRARGTAYNGREVAFEGTEEFDLAPDGRIVAVRVRWDPGVLVDQLLAAPAPATA